jgi:hypothetical protein
MLRAVGFVIGAPPSNNDEPVPPVEAGSCGTAADLVLEAPVEQRAYAA